MKLYINFLLLISFSSSNIHADVKYYESLDPFTDEEIYYENMPQRAREELMVLQKYVCKTLDVKPEDFSSIGSDDVFIYSVEPFLS